MTLPSPFTKIYTLPFPKPQLNLRATLLCGQSFRWKSLSDTHFLGVIGKSILYLNQDDEHTLTASVYPEAPEEHVKTLLEDYFQMKFDLEAMKKTWCQNQCEQYREMQFDFRRALAWVGSLRLIRQDPWECLMCFICSQNNNIKRITLMVDRLCRSYGDFIGKSEGMEFFAFPTLEQMEDVTEDELRELGFGYRAKYIVKVVKQVFFEELAN